MRQLRPARMVPVPVKYPDDHPLIVVVDHEWTTQQPTLSEAESGQLSTGWPVPLLKLLDPRRWISTGCEIVDMPVGFDAAWRPEQDLHGSDTRFGMSPTPECAVA